MDIVKEYIDEVLGMLISNINYIWGASHPSGRPMKSFSIRANPNSFINTKDSTFLCDPERPLIHFTSIRNLFSIINEKHFRLYQIDSTNDLNEVSRLAKKIGLKEKNIKLSMKKLFFASFCPFSIMKSQNELLFWLSIVWIGYNIDVEESQLEDRIR